MLEKAQWRHQGSDIQASNGLTGHIEGPDIVTFIVYYRMPFMF